MKLSILCLTLQAAFLSGSSALFISSLSFPDGTANPGERINIAWNSDGSPSSTISIVLRAGESNDLKTIGTLATANIVDGQIQLTLPESLPSDNYAIQIVGNAGDENYSQIFPVEGSAHVTTGLSRSSAAQSTTTSSFTPRETSGSSTTLKATTADTTTGITSTTASTETTTTTYSSTTGTTATTATTTSTITEPTTTTESTTTMESTTTNLITSSTTRMTSTQTIIPKPTKNAGANTQSNGTILGFLGAFVAAALMV